MLHVWWGLFVRSIAMFENHQPNERGFEGYIPKLSDTNSMMMMVDDEMTAVV